MYHEKNLVFGPALIHAYELESEVACFPRIILDSQYLYHYDAAEPGPEPSELTPEDINRLIKKDDDGFYYLDFANICEERTLEKLLQVINERMHDEVKQKALSKLNWLANYVSNNLTIKKEDV